MVEPLRHRQTKGAETDMPGLPPPRHFPTLPPVPPVFHLAKSKMIMISSVFHLFHLIRTIGLPWLTLG
jgi:hypothetical protein